MEEATKVSCCKEMYNIRSIVGMNRVKKLWSLSKRMIRCLCKEGWRVFWYKIKKRASRKGEYSIWIQQNEQQNIDVEKDLQYRPLISVVVPVYNVEPQMLTACIQSVQNQTYDNWELCLVDDCSTDSRVRETLQQYEKIKNIKIKYRTENGHISRATNDGIAMAEGEFVALLDCDDLYAENALYEVAKLLNQDRTFDFIYTDEDKISEDGKKRRDPFFKPDWSPDTFMSLMYTCHLSVYRKTLLDEIGGLRVGFEGSQDYDLVLRVMEKTKRIGHIPKILYHWRERRQSTANNISVKPYIIEATRKAKMEALDRRGAKGHLEYIEDIVMYRVVYEVVGNPKVSIVIPSKDNPDILRQCLSSIREETRYKNYEIIVVDNGSNHENHAKYTQLCKKFECKYHYEPMEFNFSRMCNIGARLAEGEYLLFLNDDIRVEGVEWLERMLGHAQQPHTGAVGCKLIYPNTNLIQHVGVISFTIGPGHAFQRIDDSVNCYFGRNKLEYNYSAVTGACLMVSREKFERIGGFCEQLPIAYNDIDLCFQLVELGYYNVVRTDVHLYHYESISRGYDVVSPEKVARQQREMQKLYNRHPEFKGYDPCYNPNLVGNSDNFSLQLLKVKEIAAPKPTTEILSECGRMKYAVEEFSDKNIVKISGWAFDRKNLRQGNVYIVLKGQDKKQYQVNAERFYRPDVIAMFRKRRLAFAGFEVAFIKQNLPSQQYEVMLVLDDDARKIGQISA